jgi:hypothetical protein
MADLLSIDVVYADRIRVVGVARLSTDQDDFSGRSESFVVLATDNFRVDIAIVLELVTTICGVLS